MRFGIRSSSGLACGGELLDRLGHALALDGLDLGDLGEGRLGLVQTAAAFDGSVANLDFALLGDGEVLRQAYGESPGVGEWINAPMRCTLQTPDFFAACASEFTPACADPESWIVSCRPVDAFTCPSP